MLDFTGYDALIGGTGEPLGKPASARSPGGGHRKGMAWSRPSVPSAILVPPPNGRRTPGGAMVPSLARSAGTGVEPA